MQKDSFFKVFTKDFISNITRQLILSEGEKLSAYYCTAGKLSIGIGHNCEAFPVPGVNKAGDKISPAKSRELFKADLKKAINDVWRYFPWVKDMSEPRQAVFYDLCFNMGIGNRSSGLRSFVNTMKAIENGDLARGVQGFMNSKYAKDVRSDGWGGRFDRAERLCTQLKKGEWIFARPYDWYH